MKKIFLKNFCLFGLLVSSMFSLPANSQIVYTDVNPDVTSSGTYNLDLNNDATIDFIIKHTSTIVQSSGHCQGQGSGTNHYFKISPSNNRAVVDYTDYLGNTTAAKMAANATIDASTLTWNSQNNQVMTSSVWGCNYFCANNGCGYSWGTSVIGQWYDRVADGFLGLRLISGGHTYYGWVRMNISSDGSAFIVKDYAYNSTADQAILAGQSSAEYLGILNIPYTNYNNGWYYFCAGKSVTVPYMIAGTFSASNTVTAELSDATGSFASPVAIGNVVSNVSGNINAVIPALTPSGYGYRIRVTSSNPARTSYANRSNLYVIRELPNGTITSNHISICEGPVYFSAATGNCYSYQWKLNGNDIPGATSSYYYYRPTVTGDYSCVKTNICGSVTSNTISVTIYPDMAPATITAAGATTVCSGTVMLNANTGAGLSYQWYNNSGSISGATGSSYAANASGAYYVIETNNYGCTRSSNWISTFIGTPAAATLYPLSGSICHGINVWLSVSPYVASYSYQWIKDGVDISGATNYYYSVSHQGTYSVRATVASGGCSSTSAGVVITQGCNTGSRASANSNEPENLVLNGLKLKIAPNPISSSATISFSLSKPGKVSLNLYDISGRLVNIIADKEFNEGNHQITLNTKDLGAGIYFLRMQTPETVLAKKLIIVK